MKSILGLLLLASVLGLSHGQNPFANFFNAVFNLQRNTLRPSASSASIETTTLFKTVTEEVVSTIMATETTTAIVFDDRVTPVSFTEV